MTAPTHHLGRARISQLLAAVGSTHATDPTPPEATVYDWRDPHSFNADQQSRLVQVMGQVAARMAETLTRARRGVCEVSLKTLTQHFAGDVCHPADFDQAYCLAFAPDQAPTCGFASITPQTTMTWGTWLLGDSESARDAHAALSALEESLLSDLFTKVLEAFLAPLRAYHDLRPTGPLTKGQPSLQYERTEEVARILFQVKSGTAGEPGEIALLLPCSRLAALAGRTAPGPESPASPQELSRALMEHVQEVPVTIRATLASTTLQFQEILNLGPGDILVLDKPLHEATELILDGRTIFRGHPARSGGKVAMVILSSEAADAQQAGAATAAGRVAEPAATAKASK